jgi:uncharacterized protein YcbK (DUF882 family)
VKINYNLLYLLEAIREHFKKPVIVNSGYRCNKHNTEINGADSSQHLLGNAADIKISGISPSQVYSFANSINKFGGLGKYDTFTHIDVCLSPATRRW